jgi:hypothetical protein
MYTPKFHQGLYEKVLGFRVCATHIKSMDFQWWNAAIILGAIFSHKNAK